MIVYSCMYVLDSHALLPDDLDKWSKEVRIHVSCRSLYKHRESHHLLSFKSEFAAILLGNLALLDRASQSWMMSDRIIDNRTLGECWCRGNELSIFIKKPTSTVHLKRREQCFRVQHYENFNYIHCTFDNYIFSMILTMDTRPLAIQREVWCVLCEFKNWLLFLRSRAFVIVDLYAWSSYIRPWYIESRYSFSGILIISMFFLLLMD